MRKNEINGLINDLLNFGSCDSPLDRSDNVGNIEIDFLKKEISYPEHDEVYNFYKKKLEWFNKRIDDLEARPGFQIARMHVSGRTESVEIVFMNDTFLGEMKHEKINISAPIVETIKPIEEIAEIKPVKETTEDIKPKKRTKK